MTRGLRVCLIATLISGLIFGPIPLRADPVRSFYRNDSSQEVLGLCNPLLDENPNENAPFAPHAVCMDKEEFGDIQRFYRYDKNGDMVGIVEGSDPTAPLTTTHTYFANRRLKNISSPEEQAFFFYTASGERVVGLVEQGGVRNVSVSLEPFLTVENEQVHYQFGSDLSTWGVDEFVFHLADQVGNILVSITSSGPAVQRDYLPYGDSWFKHSLIENVMGFNGMREDGAYLDYNARHYAAGLGKFLQADSFIPDPGKAVPYNRYAYTNNSPLIHRDDSGHFPFLVAALVGGALTAFAYRDRIENFRQFMGVFMAGMVGGALPGAGQALGGAIGSQIIGSMLAGALASVTSTAMLYGTFGAQMTEKGFFTALASGAAAGMVSGAFGEAIGSTKKQLLEQGKEMSSLTHAALRGTQNLFHRQVQTAIYSSFGYETDVSGISAAGAFLSGAVSGALYKGPDFKDNATNELGIPQYELQEGNIGKLFSASFLGDLADQVVTGQFDNGDHVSSAFLNSIGNSITNQVYLNQAVDMANDKIIKQVSQQVSSPNP